MNNFISLMKFMLIVGTLLGFGFFYSRIDMYKPSINTGDLEKNRPTAFFLNLDDSALKALENKEKFQNLEDFTGTSIGKNSLFEDVNISDYNF